MLIYEIKGGNHLNTHLHVTAWVLAFILLFIITTLYKKENNRVAKILHMVLRLIYIVVLVSGVQLLWNYFSGSDMLVEALIKSFAGLWVIGAMEMVSISTSKGQSARSGWIQLGIAFLITLLLGFARLPLGFLP